jgi:hypothetical protein
MHAYTHIYTIARIHAHAHMHTCTHAHMRFGCTVRIISTLCLGARATRSWVHSRRAACRNEIATTTIPSHHRQHHNRLTHLTLSSSFMQHPWNWLCKLLHGWEVHGNRQEEEEVCRAFMLKRGCKDAAKKTVVREIYAKPTRWSSSSSSRIVFFCFRWKSSQLLTLTALGKCTSKQVAVHFLARCISSRIKVLPQDLSRRSQARYPCTWS